MNAKLIVCSALVVSSIALFPLTPVMAAVSADEAKQLGRTLTLFGAEVAGNADGSIPAYTGGLNPPAEFKPGMANYIDPYKDEKPLYKVDAKNASQYANVLTEGAKALLARYPESYNLEVYKTHRSVKYPSWVTDNIAKNATTAKTAGEAGGDAIVGAAPDGLPFAGTPFPIPKSGHEVLWNNNLHYGPTITHQTDQSWANDASGNLSALPKTDQYFFLPWYDKTGDFRREVSDAYLGWSSVQVSPPSAAGTFFLNYYLPDGKSKAWFYTPGQRRVRAAPEFAYDVPISAFSGYLQWDDIQGHTGRMDRFDYKLVGKKEMLIPYNSFAAVLTRPGTEVAGSRHPNPTAVRWEKHRVWVVEATRKANVRHVYSRKVFYIDEDSWTISAFDAYDDAGKLWRSSFMYTFPTYDVGGVNNTAQSVHDLIKGAYMIYNISRSTGHNRSYTTMKDPALANKLLLTPQAVAAGSVR